MTARWLIPVLLLAGCASRDGLQSHVQGCAAVGHAAGSPAFSQCMSEAQAVQSSDEARERRRWMARLARERIEAEVRVRQERAMVGLQRN